MKSTPSAADDLRDPHYGSHLVPLAACLVGTTGPVLEIGVGHWSTPFLRRYCAAAGRGLTSVEGDREWAAAFGLEALDYDAALPPLSVQDWAVVLVDHWPEQRRAADALRFTATARHILVHDHGILTCKGICPRAPAGWTSKVEHETLVMSKL